MDIVTFMVYDKDNKMIYATNMERYRSEEILKIKDMITEHPFYDEKKSIVCCYDADYLKLLGMYHRDFSNMGVTMYHEVRLFSPKEINRNLHLVYCNILSRALENPLGRTHIQPVSHTYNQDVINRVIQSIVKSSVDNAQTQIKKTNQGTDITNDINIPIPMNLLVPPTPRPKSLF